MSLARRQPRLVFTRKLERLLPRMTRQREYTIEWRDRHTGHKQRLEFALTAIWVVGSYARGAGQCGDLDLLIGYRRLNDQWEAYRQMKQVLLGRPRDVQAYFGTPDENSSGVAFPEAVLLWEPGQPDWRQTLAQLAVDPEAGRFARPYDALPMPTRRHGYDLDGMERLLAALAARQIEWEWVPAPAIAASYELPERFGGSAKTTICVNRAVSYIQGQLGQTLEPFPYDCNYFGYEGRLVRASQRPALRISLLDSLDHSELILAPHDVPGAANGLWVIRRGSEHPFEKAVAGRRFWLQLTPAGELPMQQRNGSTRYTAQLATRQPQESGSRARTWREISGTAALEILARVPAARIDGKAFVEPRGYADQSRWSQVRLAALLGKQHNREPGAALAQASG